MRYAGLIVAALVALGSQGQAFAQSQGPDPEFDTAVSRPAYAENGPRVAIDEAHANFHTVDGRYKPLADLLSADGYAVTGSTEPFSASALEDVDVLIVANAGARAPDPDAAPLFSDGEAEALRAWVAAGGSLLLIADHSPFGAAAQPLAERFGIEMGEGWVFDRREEGAPIGTQIVFSRENGRLGDHPITRGRTADEQVGSVRSFTGQSLTLPAGATPLLVLPQTAHEAPDNQALQEAARAVADGGGRWDELAARHARPVGGRVQGLATEYGAGRLVVLGEAAMLSAQIVTLPAPDGSERVIRAGMNVPGTDNRQFALNILRWLSGAF